MKVLLWQDMGRLGKRGEIVEVKDGYARNFLLPKRLASEPTPGMYKEFELEKRRQARREQQLVSDAEEVAKKLQEISSVTVEVNTNEEGHLYGSVTPTMVAEALLDQGVKVEPRTVEIAEPIKQVGVYEVVVRLFKEVAPRVKIWVVSSKTLESLTPVGPGEKKEGEASAGESEAKKEEGESGSSE